jgi:hypothetical protein
VLNAQLDVEAVFCRGDLVYRRGVDP